MYSPLYDFPGIKSVNGEFIVINTNTQTWYLPLRYQYAASSDEVDGDGEKESVYELGSRRSRADGKKLSVGL